MNAEEIEQVQDAIRPTVEKALEQISEASQRLEMRERELADLQDALEEQQVIHKEASDVFMKARSDYEQVVAATDKAERAVKLANDKCRAEGKQLGEAQRAHAYAADIQWTEASKARQKEARAQRRGEVYK